MQIANYSEFRKHMKTYLDKVAEDKDQLIIHRNNGKSVVIMSVDTFNQMDETEYLVSTKANKASLDKAMEEYNLGKFEEKKLIAAEDETPHE